MKRRILLLAAFALMALLTPLGAKGQDFISLFQARRLANTDTPVCFSGTVVESGLDGIILQATDASNNTTGIHGNYAGSMPISRGDIVSVQASKVLLDSDRGKVWISHYHITDIAVVGHDDAPRVRNMTLEGMKNTHYPATPQRVINDIYQHTLVKVSNLTVVDQFNQAHYDNFIVENASHTRDTLTIYERNLTLPNGTQLASVTAINFRESGDGLFNRKLKLRSADDIEYNIRTIHYARTHLNEYHCVEGVVSYVYDRSDVNQWRVFIQDNTGGLYLECHDNPNLSVGDRVIMKVRPYYRNASIPVVSSNNTILSILGHDETISPLDTDIATLLEYQYGGTPTIYEERVVRLQNIYAKNFDRPNGCFQIYQNDPDEYIYVYCAEGMTDAQLDYLEDHLTEGSLITSVSGLQTCYCYTSFAHQIILQSLDDIEIATTHDINLSVYPSELNGSIFTASLSQNGVSSITEAAAGQRVYLHLSTTTPDNPSTINYLKASNANYSKLMHHSTRCISNQELQLTHVNSTCWSFVMPNEDVYMEALFTPTPNYDAICSDVWEAREGASGNNEEASLVFLRGVVTLNNVYIVRIQDAFNQNCSSDELKKYCGIKCDFEYDYHLQRGDNVIVCGRARTFNDGTSLYLNNARVLSTGN